MMPETRQAEKRLALAIREYVRACGRVRRAELVFFRAADAAAADVAGEEWRLATAEARPVRAELEIAEDAFHDRNGHLEKVVRILDEQLLGLRMRKAS